MFKMYPHTEFPLHSYCGLSDLLMVI